MAGAGRSRRAPPQGGGQKTGPELPDEDAIDELLHLLNEVCFRHHGLYSFGLPLGIPPEREELLAVVREWLAQQQEPPSEAHRRAIEDAQRLATEVVTKAAKGKP